MTEEVRIGVYICHCGSNIAGTVDVEEVARWAAGTCAHVVSSRDYKFMCSSLGQEMIKKDIKEMGVNRVVVASCSPQCTSPPIRSALQDAGLNPYFFEMANIREQLLLGDRVTRPRPPRKPRRWSAPRSGASPTTSRWKRVSAGQFERPWSSAVAITGIQAALEIADSGHKVYLVESEPRSAAIWHSSIRPSPPWTARPAS